jgi:phosphonatase-like hydrolase
VDLVVFDMAGTTVYDGDAVLLSLQNALRTVGVEATREEINAVMGLAKPFAIREILKMHRPEKRCLKEYVDSIHADFLRRMLFHYREDASICEVEGTTKIFRLLRESGIRIGLDTGFSRVIADTIIERLGWQRSGLIDASVTSDEVEQGRPAPHMIFRLMHRTGVSDPGFDRNLTLR